MALADYRPERHEIVLKGGSFFVKGLSLEDVSALVQHHSDDLEALFNLIRNFERVTGNDMRPVLTSMVAEAPGFAANVIAIAAGEPDMAKAAASLPAPVQIDVLLKIGDMTFSEVGGVKKALETIAALLAKAKPELITKTLSPEAG